MSRHNYQQFFCSALNINSLKSLFFNIIGRWPLVTNSKMRYFGNWQTCLSCICIFDDFGIISVQYVETMITFLSARLRTTRAGFNWKSRLRLNNLLNFSVQKLCNTAYAICTLITLQVCSICLLLYVTHSALTYDQII